MTEIKNPTVVIDGDKVDIKPTVLNNGGISNTPSEKSSVEVTPSVTEKQKVLRFIDEDRKILRFIHEDMECFRSDAVLTFASIVVGREVTWDAYADCKLELIEKTKRIFIEITKSTDGRTDQLDDHGLYWLGV